MQALHARECSEKTRGNKEPAAPAGIARREVMRGFMQALHARECSEKTRGIKEQAVTNEPQKLQFLTYTVKEKMKGK